jgi:hypothetical protein
MPLKVNLLATRMQSLVEEAERKCDQQQCEDAIGLLEEAVRIQSGKAQLHYQLGFCHSGGCRRHSLTDPDMAVEYLRHALSLVETCAPRLGRSSSRCGKTELPNQGERVVEAQPKVSLPIGHPTQVHAPRAGQSFGRSFAS